MNPLPANIDVLTRLAKETGHSYADAYSIWFMCQQHKDSYLIVDTVLWIANRQQIPVLDAYELYKGIEDQLGGLEL